MLKIVFLSRVLQQGMPLYGGRIGNFQVAQQGDLNRGDSANSLRLALTNHVGTHLDFPAHVHPGGRSLDDYPAEYFCFKNPAVLRVELDRPRYIEADDLKLESLPPEADLILIKTGFPYDDDDYWRNNPGLAPSAAIALKNLTPMPRCVGLDFISINRWPDREPGRLTHKLLLAKPEILVLEDLDLAPLDEPNSQLGRVLVAPLRLGGADGAPATVMAELSFRESNT